jgi:hypothetical protein
MAVDEVIVLFKGSVIFPTIHTQEPQTFWQQNLQTM